MKRAAPALLAFHPDAAAHQLHQPARDGKAQPGPAVFAGDGTVRLRELVEDAAEFVAGNSNPGVRHAEVKKLRRICCGGTLGPRARGGAFSPPAPDAPPSEEHTPAHQ